MSVLDAVTISRRKGQSEFDLLRSELLSHVQKLSANKWTDFNTHDPGVTILEQLAYALSDVNYRMDYPVDELLADSTGGVALEEHGLFVPEDALTCRPVNTQDLQKYLLDTIPDLAFVEVEYSIDYPGLIHLKISSRQTNDDEQQLIETVKAQYATVRNLCENISSVRLIDKNLCDLTGRVQLKEYSNIEETMNAVYIEIQRFLMGDVRKINLANSLSDPRMFDGPNMLRMPIDDSELDFAKQPRPMSALVKRLMAVPGVLSVEDLRCIGLSSQLGSGQGKLTTTLPPAREQTFYVDFQRLLNSSGLKFFQNDKPIYIDPAHSYHELQTAIHQIDAEISDFSSSESQKNMTANCPNLSIVSSVQSQFPSNYGINSFGVPAHSNIERKSQARQLQGYLLLFDQIMHDHLLMADHLKSTFSTDIQEPESYPTTVVVDKNAYELSSLYKTVTDDRKVPELLRVLDRDPSEIARKNKVLDFLLAINGRENVQFGIEHFNPFYSERELSYVGMENRKCALENVHCFSQNRGSAFNIHNRSWLTENISTLEKQVRLMLGVPLKKMSCLYKTLSLFSEELKSHPSGEQPTWNSIHYQSVNQDIIQSRIGDGVEVPSVTLPESINRHGLSEFLSERKTILTPAWTLIQQLGGSMDRYRLCQLKNKRSIDLLLNIGQLRSQPSWVYLASFKKLEEGVFFVNVMRHFLLQENLRVEGVHLVEHLLLHSGAQPESIDETDDSFYFNQLTMVFPSYSTRYRQEDFRNNILDFILGECPAHLHCHVLWLDHKAMQEFELLMSDWLKQLRKPDSKSELVKAASSMTTFLKQRLGQGNA
jgi:hypothetical protein